MLRQLPSPRQRQLLLIGCLCLLTLSALPFSIPAVGAQEIAADVTLYVNNGHSRASDSNPGTQDKPFKTIDAALEEAKEQRGRGKSSTIRIADGTYRESVSTSLRDGDPIVLEAINSGKVIVSGSDVWGDWKRGSDGVYTRDWPHNWGVAANPWADDVEVPPIVRRHELVAVNSTILRQVLSKTDLTAGTFHVDEGANRISIKPPSGVDLNQALIEVGMREQVFKVQGGNNLTIRGLVFQHSTEVLDQAAVVFQNIEDLLVEDCVFEWNNGIGLKLFSSHDVTVRNSVANHNGFDGMAGYKLRNLLLEDNITAHNNWRGDWGEFYYWATGQKFMSIHGGVIRNHQSYDNESRGFWLDLDNTNIVFEGGSVHDNRRDGLFIEANLGPIVVKDATFAHNGNAGILINHSQKVTLEGNTLCNNVTTQLRVSGTKTSRNVRDWETGQTVAVWGEDMTFVGNTLVGYSSSQLLFESPLSGTAWNRFEDTLTSNNNRYFNASNAKVFRLSGNKKLDLKGWQSQTGQDRNSTWADVGTPSGC